MRSIVVAGLLAGTAFAQTSAAQVVTNPDAEAAKALAARSGYDTTYQLQCRVSGTRPGGMIDHSAVPATKLFDNFYYVGVNSVGSYALKTSAGIILFDALNNAKEAETVIVPGMKAVGLNPADIKYVVITTAAPNGCTTPTAPAWSLAKPTGS
jgi:metallo-beta-lactamase class B